MLCWTKTHSCWSGDTGHAAALGESGHAAVQSQPAVPAAAAARRGAPAAAADGRAAARAAATGWRRGPAAAAVTAGHIHDPGANESAAPGPATAGGDATATRGAAGHDVKR